jgi:SET domain-containing protein
MATTTTSKKTPSPNRDFIRVGRSRIQGTGVFAKRKIPKGTRVIEYLGERVPMNNLLVELVNGSATAVYTFRLTDSTAIDGARNGNDARWINHSCDPNCEAYVFDERVYIYAMRDITRGEELTFDYHLGSPFGKRRMTKSELLKYACMCGSPNCRGTMIAAKRSSSKSRSRSKR